MSGCRGLGVTDLHNLLCTSHFVPQVGGVWEIPSLAPRRVDAEGTVTGRLNYVVSVLY